MGIGSHSGPQRKSLSFSEIVVAVDRADIPAPLPGHQNRLTYFSPILSMPQLSLGAPQVKEMLFLVADRIIAAEPMLSEADRNLGDGDHGLGMQRGLTAVKEKLSAAPAEETIDKLLSASGMAMISSMGGASGAIFGTLFRDGGKSLAGQSTFGAPELATFLRAACDGVMARGKAAPGDKTMIDALHPAAAAAATVVDQPLAVAIATALEAALVGTEGSKAMIAKFGRAKTLGEAAIGFPDAGALSVTVILQAMHDFIIAA
jgi:phosphoenolpyruvate---glycerone phosphotransferase subunit DhaL